MSKIKLNSIVFLLSVMFALSFSSCNNSDNDKVVGHWRYSESSDLGNITGVMNYNSDGSTYESGTMTYIFTDDDEESLTYGVETTLIYGLKSYGTYSVSGTTLTETTNNVNISFKSAKTNLSGEYKDLERELIKIYRDIIEENNFKELKAIAYGTTTEEIITVNDTKMVLKSVDENGESDITEYERLYEAR